MWREIESTRLLISCKVLEIFLIYRLNVICLFPAPVCDLGKTEVTYFIGHYAKLARKKKEIKKKIKMNDKESTFAEQAEHHYSAWNCGHNN